MRTTLTIDDDVALLLRKEIRRSGEPFKQAVNRCLRAALSSSAGKAPAKPFKVTPIALQLPEGINLDKTSAILEALEGPMHR
ncbi:MAG: DUF2191 domain-containing protein [Acidobacteria bacterium]|nr:DUF2191 domain-containing protein [Acidobacteriota bacterium]